MPWLAFRQAPLAGVLRLEWPSRQAPLPLAGALTPWLEYFVLEWLQRNHGGPWRSPGKPCRRVLRLPVHKFRIVGYPYSSTPTRGALPSLYAWSTLDKVQPTRSVPMLRKCPCFSPIRVNTSKRTGRGLEVAHSFCLGNGRV